jgi:signal peptidase I
MYSLRKSKKIFCHIYYLYKRQKKKLSESQNVSIQNGLKELQEALLNKDRRNADRLAKNLESVARSPLKKTPFRQFRDLISALLFALVIAIIVRQMWFEFYEIPTGSMRPTLKEKDRLVVSKTDFGINLPLTTQHIYFDPSLVQRNSIFIFTGENMDIRDIDTLYFYIFPGKKQYIKRLLGKPGDTLYFYGGLIYGIDAQGSDISKELQPDQLAEIDHIPFIQFEGKISTPKAPLQGIFSPVILSQMNEPIARLYLSSHNQPRGEMLVPNIQEYGDLWGFKNYAMARLLTAQEVKEQTNHSLPAADESPLYLELKHTPSLNALQVVRDELGRFRPALGFSTSIIPCDETLLRSIFDHLYTARFLVKKGKAYRYGMPSSMIEKNPFLPQLPDVPDGCYEFYNGKAYEVKWEGITFELPSSHPLYTFTPQRVQFFYNLGIEFDTRYSPQVKNQRLYPSRYAYFRKGDLYLLGAPLLKKEDPLLLSFVAQQLTKPHPFVDNGPPLLPNGEIDKSFILHYGLKIPEKGYLALGDNHAMSSDSRDFGFVPQGNLRGGPVFIFWPPGPRFGAPNQVPYPLFNMPRTVIWITAGIVIGAWYLHHRKRTKLPLI